MITTFYNKNIGKLPYIILFTYCFCKIFITIQKPFQEIVYFLPDDASYYFKIAENLYNGFGFSFDTFNTTNGFHPLWQILIIPFFAFINEPEILVRTILVFQCLILTITGLLLIKVANKFFTSEIVLLLIVFYVYYVFSKSVNGMESAVLVFTISFFIFYFINNYSLEVISLKEDYLLGILISLILLSRLDMIFLVITLPVFLIIVSKLKKIDLLKRLFIIFLGFLSLFIPYIAFNFLSEGKLTPISGALKSSFPNLNNSISLTGYPVEIWISIALVLINIILFLLVKFKIFNSPNFLKYNYTIVVVGISIFLTLVYTILFVKWGIFNWYYIIYFFYIPIAFVPVIQILFSLSFFKRFRFEYLLIIVACYFCYSLVKIELYRYDRTINAQELHNMWHVQSYNAAKWAKANLDHRTIFGMTDAGHFSFFSQMRVVNLDGLVNNFKFQNILYEKKLSMYLRNLNVSHLVHHSFWMYSNINRDQINEGNYNEIKLNFPSYLYNTFSDNIQLRKSKEIYRSPKYFDENEQSVFLIWQIE